MGLEVRCMGVDLSALHENLKLAQSAYDSAKNEANAARSAETSALNNLNRAQKSFDTAVEEARKSAPRDSDWGRERISKP